VKKLTSWSFSRYSEYGQCPLRAKFKYLDKIKEPTNAPMLRGQEIHKKAEDYIKGTITNIPSELRYFATDFRLLRQLYARRIRVMAVEETWAFTNEWDKTTFDDWTGCWVRVKADCAFEHRDGSMVVIDWKTGKFHQDGTHLYLEQLELISLAALLQYPHIDVVEPRLAYLDHDLIYPSDKEVKLIKREYMPTLMKSWELRTKAMMSDTQFDPRPSDKCRFCFFRHSNAANGGGQCKY